MLRLLVTPRWLAGTVLALVATAVCWSLGAWQFDRAHLDPRPVSISDERVIPFVDVSAQAAGGIAFPSGLLVRSPGVYSGDGFVIDAPGDARVRWAAAALDTPGSAAEDVAPTALTVVRGAARPAPSDPRSGDVIVTGRLQPPAADGDLSAAALSARGTDPRGYLVLTSQVPQDVRPAELVDSPLPLRASGLRWQNSVYAAQWWIFGGFVLFMWFRLFRDDLRAARA